MRATHLLVPSLRAGLAAALVLTGSSAQAQADRPLIRGDVSGSIGWLRLNTDNSAPHRGRDWHDSFFGGVSLGWHWTDHLKSEIDFGADTQITVYTGEPLIVDGRRTFRSRESALSSRVLGISQVFQFFRNAWVHPHLAAGAAVVWERSAVIIGEVTIYDPDTGTHRVVAPARTEGPRTDAAVKPFVASGFKAYMTPRVFFRSDLRVDFRSGPDGVLLRFGVGADF